MSGNLCRCTGYDGIINGAADLDLEMTEVLVIAAASALAAGSTVMIDLDPEMPGNQIGQLVGLGRLRHGGQRRRVFAQLPVPI